MNAKTIPGKRIFLLRYFPTLHFEKRIHGNLPVPQDTAQLTPTPIPGAENLSKRNCYSGQFCADRPAQEPVIMEDADLGDVSRIETQGDRFANVRCQRR